jgi:penicillin-binding protein 2
MTFAAGVGRPASSGGLALGVLLAAFFRAQVLEHAEFALQSDDNRLNEVPLPAPRGMILDRNGQVIAENIPGYTVSMLSPRSDSLRAALKRLSSVLPLSDSAIEVVVRRFRAAPARPALILQDASFEQVSMLEEERSRFPNLVIQDTPKRRYPDGQAVASIVGYTGEINEAELATETYKDYRPGQQIGRAGLEREYEAVIHGRDGSKFVEVDARGRVVRQAGARPDRLAEAGPELRHEHRHRPAAIHRQPVRFHDAGRRGGHRPEDGRRPRAPQRAGVRP